MGYFQSVITICRKPSLLVMPGSPTELPLYLCWPKSNTTHATIKILHAKEPKLPNFYNALKFAIEQFDNLQEGEFAVRPTKAMTSSDILKDINVYQHEGMVYKFFDTVEAEFSKPNKQLILEVLGHEYLERIYVTKLTTDGRYQMMMYKFIENDKQTISCDDFKPILNSLYKLHISNYVHLDVGMKTWCFLTTEK